MDKNKCSSCGEAPQKCSCKNKEFTKAVIEIDNPEQITLMRKVVIPASMGDDTTVPPVVGKYHNVLLYYEANQKSYLYSSDGIPTQLVNGVTDYEAAVNLPQINGVTLLGDKSAADLELADAPMVITVANGNTSWSGADTAEDVYDFFLNKGKVNIVFDGGENYAYEIASAGYIEDEGKLLCVVVAASTQNTGGVTDFDGNALFGTMTLYTAGKAVDVSQIELQPKLYIADFTGLSLNYNELSGLPATNYSIGMVKPGDGLEVNANGTMSISDIEQYAHFFDTVADMKAANNLVAGDYVRTLGYYAKDDMGGAYYKISSTAPSGHYETLTSGLYAELVLQDTMNVKQFGAKGDGATDDTTSIQTAINNSEILNVPSGIYMVNSITHISIPSNRTLRLSEAAVFKSITNDQDGYAILYLNDVDNVEISGGTIQGDRDTHTGATGEWGHCISIYSSSNINIHDIKLIDAWGDGLYINDVTNIVTNNIIIDKARRNGISVISVNGYRGDNTIIKNISGTAPESGIDFEPNATTDVFKNIILTNFSTSNTAFGICFALNHVDSTSAPIDVIFNNFCDHSSSDGMRLTKNTDVTGTIVFNGIRLYDNPVNPIALRNFAYGSSFSLQCNDIYIKRSTADGTNQDYAAIRGYGNQTNGNIYLKNIEIYQTGVNSNVPDIYIRDANDISIINPIHRTNSVTISNDQNFRMYDPLYTYTTRSGSGGGYVGASDMRSLSIKDNTGYSSTTVDFTAQAPVGYQCTFVNINASQTYGIKLPADTYCRAFSSSAAPTITLAPGATLTLRKIDTYEVVPINQSGTITAS